MLFLFVHFPNQIYFVTFKQDIHLLTPRYELESFKSIHFLKIYFSYPSLVLKFNFQNS
jgi:hypothetical protein